MQVDLVQSRGQCSSTPGKAETLERQKKQKCPGTPLTFPRLEAGPMHQLKRFWGLFALNKGQAEVLGILAHLRTWDT